jgi:Tol biopolymer transport system component
VRQAMILAVLALVAAACGSSGSDSGSAPAKNGPIAYAMNQIGPFGIYSQDPGGRAHRLTTQRDFFPRWSPDGKRLAFERIFDSDHGLAHLYVMNADGSDAHQVGTIVSAAEGISWSPEGDRLAFTDGASDIADIAVVKTDGSGKQTVAKEALDPAWSPNGDFILFRRASGLWLVRPDGSDAHMLLEVTTPDQLSADFYVPLYPSWSPDGERIVYARTNLTALGGEGKPTGAVVTVDKDGKDERTVARFHAGRGDGVGPSWSPDGRMIAYYDDPSDVEIGVFVVPAEGGTPKLVVDEIGAASPSWGPAGT